MTDKRNEALKLTALAFSRISLVEEGTLAAAAAFLSPFTFEAGADFFSDFLSDLAIGRLSVGGNETWQAKKI